MENGNPRSPDELPAIVEHGESDADDWFGEDLERDREDAERALELVGGDEVGTEEIFEDIRQLHKSDDYDVPADERPT